MFVQDEPEETFSHLRVSSKRLPCFAEDDTFADFVCFDHTPIIMVDECQMLAPMRNLKNLSHASFTRKNPKISPWRIKTDV